MNHLSVAARRTSLRYTVVCKTTCISHVISPNAVCGHAFPHSASPWTLQIWLAPAESRNALHASYNLRRFGRPHSSAPSSLSPSSPFSPSLLRLIHPRGAVLPSRHLRSTSHRCDDPGWHYRSSSLLFGGRPPNSLRPGTATGAGSDWLRPSLRYPIVSTCYAICSSHLLSIRGNSKAMPLPQRP